MKADEAIKYLKQLYVVPPFTLLDARRNDALEIAINKLKEEEE